MKLTPEMEEQLRETFRIASYNGSSSTTWTGEGKEAYEDGMYTILSILGIKVDGINA